MGELAFGKVGKIVMTFTQYVTLGGVTVIFMILFGITHAFRSLSPTEFSGVLMNSLSFFSCVPAALYSLGVGVLVTLLNLAIPKLKEASWMTPFAVISTLVAVVVSVVVSLNYYMNGDVRTVMSRLLLSYIPVV